MHRRSHLYYHDNSRTTAAKYRMPWAVAQFCPLEIQNNGQSSVLPIKREE